MSEGTQPFTEYVTKPKPGQRASMKPWIVGGIFAALLGGAVYLWLSARADVKTLEALRPSLDQANASLTNALAEIQQDKDQMTSLQAQVAGLQQEKEKVGQAAQSLEDEMRKDLESKDVTISQLQGKLTVNILDRIMFDSGEADLKPDGQAVLQKVAAILAEHPKLKIHVIGHTDNVPIRARFASNWELSTARALAAVHFLTEKAGIDPLRVGAVGYGEYRPIADNSTPEGRAKNRRIAITILPDELAGSDAASTVNTNTLPVAPVTP